MRYETSNLMGAIYSWICGIMTLGTCIEWIAYGNLWFGALLAGIGIFNGLMAWINLGRSQK